MLLDRLHVNIYNNIIIIIILNLLYYIHKLIFQNHIYDYK